MGIGMLTLLSPLRSLLRVGRLLLRVGRVLVEARRSAVPGRGLQPLGGLPWWIRPGIRLMSCLICFAAWRPGAPVCGL